ncbi:MAG: hypothetical protein WCR58_09965 [Bacteroidales bacterium]|nr:hypothetical protein [Bacteroidales bacterium]MDY0369462.1 hypothetical protein [Bacteroidales bacterium]
MAGKRLRLKGFDNLIPIAFGTSSVDPDSSYRDRKNPPLRKLIRR